MSLRKAIWLIALLFCFVPSVGAQTKWTYNASYAVSYATRNYSVQYGSGSGQNPFSGFQNNCANFVSQAIVGGLTRKTTPADVYSQRLNFTADIGSPLAWYFVSPSSRGSAWAGAKEMYQYAKGNKASYKGLHFTFITNDSPIKRMDYNLVKEGDVVFADWESNGVIDHVMIVSRVCGILSLCRGYNRIRLTYQSNNVTDRGLEDINIQYGYRVSFYVYRPTDYNQLGL